MHSNNVNVLIDKVVSVIQKLKEASATEIKRKISAFHQEAGGAEKLQKILTNLLSTGKVTVRTEKSRNGQSIEFYRLANSSANDSNYCHVAKDNNGITPKINVKIEIDFEGWDEIFTLLSSLVNTDIGSSEHKVEPEKSDAPFVGNGYSPFADDPVESTPIASTRKTPIPFNRFQSSSRNKCQQ